MGPGLIVVGILILFVLIMVASGMFTVQQRTHAVVERFGRFHKIAAPGLNVKLPFIESIAGRVGHRVKELEIKVESKTKDDVFVDLLIAVQYYVPEDLNAVKFAYYKLTNPQQQISSYVFDTVRALVPDMAVDHVFAEKDKIAWRSRNGCRRSWRSSATRSCRRWSTTFSPTRRSRRR